MELPKKPHIKGTATSIECYRAVLAPALGIKLVQEVGGKDTINIPPVQSPAFKLNMQLAASGRNIDVILGDGNCFFRAISKELFGKQCFHYNMRTNLMEFIQNHPNMFEPLVFQGSLDQHCKKVSKPGAFATQVEMQAMTTFLQMPIYLYSQQVRNGPTQWEWLWYTPQKIPSTAYKYNNRLKNFPLEYPENYHIELCHTNLNHFDRVVSATRFPLPPTLNGENDTKTIEL